MTSSKLRRAGTSAFSLVLIGLGVAACVRTSTIPLRADLIQISTSAAPVCGAQGAQQAALKQAAIETIKRGYDRLIIVATEAQNNVRVVGYTPGTATTYGTATATGYGNTAFASGQSTTYYNQGMPIVGGSHDQGLTVQMFKNKDPAGRNALSARDILGPDWEEAVNNGTSHC